MKHIATIISIALCAYSTFGASVTRKEFGDIGLSENVVTAVDLSGIPTDSVNSNDVKKIAVKEAGTMVSNVVPSWARSQNAPVTTETDPMFSSATNNGMTVNSNVTIKDQTLSMVYGSETNGIKITEKGVEGSWGWSSTPGVGGIWVNTPFAFSWSKLITNESDPTVPSWAKSSNPPVSMPNNGLVLTNNIVQTKSGTTVTPENIDAAPSSLTTTVDRIVRNMTGSNVWFSVTNYENTVPGINPSLSLHEKIVGTDTIIWNELVRYNALQDWTKSYVSNNIDAAMIDVPDRAWSLYDSGTGLEAPSNTTWVSTPNTVLAGNLTFVKYVSTAGAVWVLKSNGMVSNIGTDTNGYLRIKDASGETAMEIRKEKSQTIGCIANETYLTTTNGVNHMFISYQLSNSVPPVIYASKSLDDSFICETNANSIVNTAWTGSSGDWVCEVYAKVQPAPTLFCYAETSVAGGTMVEIKGRASFTGGIVCTDGIHYVRPVYSNGTITWEVVP